MEKTTDKLIISGNNTGWERTIIPLDRQTKKTGGSASTKPGMNQGGVVKEMGNIWKPHVVDGRGHDIFKNHSSLMNPTIVANISMVCVLLIDTVEI